MNQQEIKYLACLLAVGPPPNKIKIHRPYGLVSQSDYRSQCHSWFIRSRVAGKFHARETAASCGEGWWVDYKRWLWENQNEAAT